ncbi:hypothetical protein [Butyrivibrio sp. AC2005]|uniref:hypothetical protein n=1 Tax=Butyrivibrio sp. AC2005 TaxID=1280672 RepID=UPI000479037D|nr:hypothetical protein [Butyrivibrio sp. AC2005]
MNNKKNSNLVPILIAIFIIILVGVRIWMKAENEKLYDSLDAAREVYRDDIKKADIYDKKDGDYFKEISVVTIFDDNNLSNSWFHTNYDSVTVKLDDSINELMLKERCLIMVTMINEMQDNLQAYYEKSEYNKIYEENKGMSSMKYRGIYLDIYHKAKFIFNTSRYIYTFEYVNSMTVKDKQTGETKYYDYWESDGVLKQFEDRYGSKTSSKSSIQSSTSESTKPNQKGASSAGSQNSYDPYNVNDYKSSEEFADDKYEEFYDYEDDYEDEDEAYDAAEDYWNEHH